MSQITFEDLVNGTTPDASDFNSRFNALKNRINNGMEADNIANSAITTAKIANNAIDATKLDETDDYTWTGTHDYSGATVTGISANSPTGIYKGLKVLRATASTVDIDIDELIVSDGTDNSLLKNVNLTVDITSSGADGLDTGAEGSSRWYYLWVVYNDTTVAGLLSESSSSPTVPTGYDKKALVSAVFNDGSSDFIDFVQYGIDYFYTDWRVLASGSSTAQTVTLTVSDYVPSALSEVARGSIEGGLNAIPVIGNQTPLPLYTASPGKGNIVQVYNGDPQAGFWELNLQTANTLYWSNGSSSTAYVYIAGFKITKLG